MSINKFKEKGSEKHITNRIKNLKLQSYFFQAFEKLPKTSNFGKANFSIKLEPLKLVEQSH